MSELKLFIFIGGGGTEKSVFFSGVRWVRSFTGSTIVLVGSTPQKILKETLGTVRRTHAFYQNHVNRKKSVQQNNSKGVVSSSCFALVQYVWYISHLRNITSDATPPYAPQQSGRLVRQILLYCNAIVTVFRRIFFAFKPKIFWT